MPEAASPARLRRWVAGYEAAWRTPDDGLDDVLGELFAHDASYRTAPYERPHRGLAAIAALWRSGREGPDEVFQLASDIVAVDGDVGVVRLEVRYGDPIRQEYRDLWIVSFDPAGRCRAFEEWPFWPEGTSGGYHPGPEAS